jgi:hypothetical protein
VIPARRGVLRGKYRFRCTRHPQQMRGVAIVPFKVLPKTGTTEDVYGFIWATMDAPAGFNYDVQVMRPGEATWGPFITDTTNHEAESEGLAPAGTWRFRSRMQLGTGNASQYSPAFTVTVSNP